MKRNQIILCCCMVILLFTACNKTVKTSELSEGTQITETSTEIKETTETQSTEFEPKWEEKSFLWKEPFLALDDLIENYTPYKEVVYSGNRFAVSEIEMPNAIDNAPVNQIMAFFFNGQKVLIELQNAQNDICVYDFASRECEVLFHSKDYLDEGMFAFRTFVEDKIIFISSVPGMGCVYDAHLWAYDRKDKTLKKIYDYQTKEDGHQSINLFMEVEVIGDRIIFDDFEYDPESKAYVSNLYFYDFAKEEVVLEKERAVKPVKYKDSYACFVEDGHGSNYCTLVDCDGNVLWNVDEYSNTIVSNGKDIYIIAMATSDEMQTTKRGFMGIDKNPVLVTYSTMGSVYLNEKWMMIGVSCYQYEGYPILYNLQEEKIYELESVPKTFSYYYMPVYGSDDCVVHSDRKFYLIRECEENWGSEENPVYENMLEYDNEILAKTLEDSGIDEVLTEEIGLDENVVELIRKWAKQQKERYAEILVCGEKAEIIDSRSKKLAEATNERLKMVLGEYYYDVFCEWIGANLQ